MDNSVLIALIVVGGGLLSIVVWKVLDIGKRAMELDRSGHTESDKDA